MHPHHAMGVRHDYAGHDMSGCTPHHEMSGHHMGGPHHMASHPLGKHGALHGDGMQGYHGATSSYGSGDEGGAADMIHGMHDAKHHELHKEHASAHKGMEAEMDAGSGEEHEEKHGAAFPGAAPPFKKKG